MDHYQAEEKQSAEADHPRVLYLAVKLDSTSVFMCLCDKKLNFLSWAIMPVFADPVAYICGLDFHMHACIFDKSAS